MIFELESCPLGYLLLDGEIQDGISTFSRGKLINIILDNIIITDTCNSRISDTCIRGLPII